jgi:hypothetical protein
MRRALRIRLIAACPRPTPAPSTCCPVIKVNLCSRRMRARVMCQESPKTLPQNPTPPDKSGRWGPASSRSDPENQNRKREAERRETDCQFSAPSGAAARSKTERARLSAFHRGSRQPVHYLLTQLQARLPGTRFRRVFPAIFCPSPGSTSRIGHSTDGLMPGAARERVTNSLAGTALAPSIDRRRLRSLSSERDLIIDIVALAKTSKYFRCGNYVRFSFAILRGRVGACGLRAT